MEVPSYDHSYASHQETSSPFYKKDSGIPPLPRGFKPRPFAPTLNELVFKHTVQYANDHSRFEISKPDTLRLPADTPISSPHRSYASLSSLDTDSDVSEPTSPSKKSSSQKLSPLPIPLETLKEDVVLCTIDRIFSLKTANEEEQFLIESAHTSQNVPTILAVKRAFLNPSQEKKLEKLLEIFCNIDNMDLAQSLAYFLQTYKHNPQYGQIVEAVQATIEKKFLKDLLVRFIGQNTFSPKDFETIDLHVQDPNCCFEMFQDVVSFYIIGYIFSLKDKTAEKAFLISTTRSPFLSGYEQFFRIILSYKHMCLNTPSSAIGEKLTKFFMDLDDSQTLLQIFYYIKKTEQFRSDPHLLNNLKIITQKKRLQEKVEEWIGRIDLDAAIKNHSIHQPLSAEVSWDKFQEAIQEIVLTHIFHLRQLDPSLEKTIKSLSFDEEYENTILVCLNTHYIFLNGPASKICEKLVENFKLILYPDCLQRAALFLEKISPIAQPPVRMLMNVSCKKNLWDRSYEHLDITSMPIENQELLKKAVNDPHVDQYDFKELLTLFTIEQIFSRNKSKNFTAIDTLHSNIVLIKKALESQDPENDLSLIASKLKRPELFLQIAHFLFTQEDWENHAKILQFVSKHFPIEDVTTSYKACFSETKKEWCLEQVPTFKPQISSFYSLPQNVWDLLQTHQLDQAAREMEKLGTVWEKIAPLLARRQFTAVYELMNQCGHMGNWKDVGARFFLLLGRPDLALKVSQPSTFHYSLEKRTEKFALIIQNILTHPNLGYLLKLEALNAVIKSLSSWEYDPWKGYLSLLLINDFEHQALELAHSIKQACYKESLYEELVARKSFYNAWHLLDQDRKLIKKYQEHLGYDQRFLERISKECMELEKLLELDQSRLLKYQANLAEQERVRFLEMNIEKRHEHFLALKKSIKITEKNIESLQSNISLLQSKITRLQRKSEQLLAESENLYHIVQNLLKIYHSRVPETSQFCENVLYITTQSWITQIQEQPEKAAQLLRELRVALSPASSAPLRAIACKVLCKSLTPNNVKQSLFYEALIAIAATIENATEKQALYDFCFAENHDLIIQRLLREEPFEPCKRSVCIKFLEKGKIDEALAAFDTIKSLLTYEETAKEFIDTLLSWNAGETKQLVDEGLQKMLSILKNAPSTPRSDMIKQNICLEWIHKRILKKETLELMETIQNPQSLNTVRRVLAEDSYS